MNDSAEKLDPLFRQELFFWCCAAVSLLALLGSHSLFWVEPRVAEAAREIVVTGRWYPLTNNFAECPDLPRIEVWSVALIFKFGISEFAARLPSAVAALALLIGTRRLAGQLFDRGTALLAGWLTLGSCGVLFLGRSCGSGVFSAAVVLWTVVWYLRGAGESSFWCTLNLCMLLALGVLNVGLSFLWLPAALLLPWIRANWRRPDRNWRRVAAAAGIAVVVLYLAEALICGDPTVAAVKKLWKLVASGGLGASFKAWWSGGDTILPSGFRAMPRIMLPWPLIAVTVLVGAMGKFRRLESGDKCLLAGIVLGFGVLSFPPSSRWPDFLPLVPFLALETGVGMLRGDGGRFNRWSVIATRAVIVVAAAFAVVSPVTIPVWQLLMDLDLPTLFWAACFVFGALVLLIMMLDSYPTRPLSHLTGLPDPLGSTILGGTLASICMISFLLPALRELRAEKPFMLEVAATAATAGIEPGNVVTIGGGDSTALLLFYSRFKTPVTEIPDGGSASADRLKAVFLTASCRRFCVIAPRRAEDLDFLHRCVAAAGAKIDLDDPSVLEEVPAGYGSPGRRLACWLISLPERKPFKFFKFGPTNAQ